MELHRLAVPAPHLLPFAIGSFESIGPESLAAYPHRHTFFEIAIVTGGRGRHVLDFVPDPLEPPRLWVVSPGQVHHWQDARDVTGWVILFNEDFLLGHPDDAEALRVVAAGPQPGPGPRLAARMTALATEMHDEYRSGGEGYVEVLRAALHILVVWAVRLSAPSPVPQPPSPAGPSAGRGAELAAGFARLVARAGPGDRSIGRYARELGVSAAHLHEVVRRQAGRTPGQLIREQQTLEAKRLIAATNLTIRQIAAEVGFDDPAYFSRFFRRETGLSPVAFRREVREMHPDCRIESIVAPDGRA
ncbi:helix-turn-helix domain-containing protein [Kitasatospora sp. NE20-6]|uniref:helix-turn-helix domain-containing protein n=1 Tax=Kitasatospora sp. NE20-6 TaxID=2859066 RepID=UPI0038B380B7